jgi:hypothetical protein
MHQFRHYDSPRDRSPDHVPPCNSNRRGCKTVGYRRTGCVSERPVLCISSDFRRRRARRSDYLAVGLQQLCRSIRSEPSFVLSVPRVRGISPRHRNRIASPEKCQPSCSSFGRTTSPAARRYSALMSLGPERNGSSSGRSAVEAGSYRPASDSKVIRWGCPATSRAEW